MRVIVRIERGDARKRGFRQLDGRDLARADGSARIRN
jgi:hypothetical protein